jgi:protoporphyrinogen/coproporphyrinogen III oxidase
MKVAVVGGGISGLSAAFRLRQAGAEVVVLEADTRSGGKIRSEPVEGGWLVEHGPNGFLDSRTQVLDLAKDVGLEARITPADDKAKRRYLFIGGRLRAAPAGPLSFMTSDLLTVAGRARMMAEPFVKAKRDGVDESVYDFASRRIGKQGAERLVDPMVSGIYAGDVTRLSLQAAFPRLHRLEQEHGGLVRGMMALMKAKKADTSAAAGPAGTLTSFPGGLSEFVRALDAKLAGCVHTGRPVTAVERAGERWRVVAGGGDPVLADAVVLSTPTAAIARLVGPLAAAAIDPLEAIRYAPAAVVALGFDPKKLPRPLDGFGFLVPSGERRRVLGVLWSSAIFPSRAPTGQALLRCIVGGSRQPELLDLDDDELVGVVTAELGITMGGAVPDPTFKRVVRWPAGIPQYELGHLDRVAAAQAAVAPLKGIHLAGNGLFGVSLADCVARGDALPALVLNGA